MTDIADLPEAQVPQGDLPPFLDKEQKIELIENQHGFLITGSRPNVASNSLAYPKPQVIYEIAFLSQGAVDYLGANGKGKDGKVKTSTGEYVDPTQPAWAENSQRWALSLTHDEKGIREGQATQIAEVLVHNNMVGPCWLSEIPPKTPGHSATRVILGHPQPVEKKPKRQPVAAAASTSSDDGLPF